MRRTVSALLGAVALVASAGCATGPGGSLVAGDPTMIDVPFRAERNTVLVDCEHSGGWYDAIAAVCDRPSE